MLVTRLKSVAVRRVRPALTRLWNPDSWPVSRDSDVVSVVRPVGRQFHYAAPVTPEKSSALGRL